MGLTGLSVLHGVVSSVLSSSAVLCGLHCDWLQLEFRCNSSIDQSLRPPQMLDSVSLAMCCCRGNDEAMEPTSAGRATAVKV